MSKKFRRSFRKNKRINHPTYVVDKQDDVYEYIGITHSKITNGKNNIPLRNNPNPNDSRQAYVRPILEKDIDKNFGKRYSSWNFSKSDTKKVNKLIDKNKKSR